ncbi:hypothetical protein SKAU_G00308360 [Synaphobranchus kaupii]|uniref:Uncharacterized protein n=1 Tax=Synaphobranchus kaupii TaxID=118154 RepID=A0A9Q1ERA7_SYNKA|nr:hypothetical protein SKAU_G00308360 [Synaphobranchus kaupii]
MLFVGVLVAGCSFGAWRGIPGTGALRFSCTLRRNSAERCSAAGLRVERGGPQVMHGRDWEGGAAAVQRDRCQGAPDLLYSPQTRDQQSSSE